MSLGNESTKTYDILYYSRFCKHSNNILQYMTRTGLVNHFSFICVDKRARNPTTNQWMLQLDNGKTVALPYSITNVPSLLLVNQKYRVLVGNEIMQYLEPLVREMESMATKNNGEPGPARNLGVNKVESFTFTNDHLMGSLSGVYSPVMNEHISLNILTPPEDFKSARLNGDEASNAIKQIQDDINKYTGGLAPLNQLSGGLPPGINRGGGYINNDGYMNNGGHNYNTLEYRPQI